MAPKKAQLKGAARASVESKTTTTADVELDGGQSEVMDVEQENTGMSTADRVKAGTMALLRQKQKRLNNPEEGVVLDDEYYENHPLMKKPKASDKKKTNIASKAFY